MTTRDAELHTGILRRLNHMLGAHSDSPQWYENQIKQTIRWMEEFERRNPRETAALNGKCH